MDRPLLHVFRNAPYGRETLLQSAYTCRRLQLPLDIYLPREHRFLFYFAHEVVQVDLDSSYLRVPEKARKHAEDLLQLGPELDYRFISVKAQTASGLPDLPNDFSFMACPRSMSDVTSRIGLGHIGPKVRRIVQSAPFPVLIPAGAFKPWTRLVVLYGGSDLAAEALRLAVELRRRSNAPLQVLSFGQQDKLRQQAVAQGVDEILGTCEWHVLPGAAKAEHLYAVPHDALVVLGAYGHGKIKSLFGSTMETVQAELPNPMMVVGPQYTSPA